MDYFIVFLLVIIIFTFLSDQKVLKINEVEGKISGVEKIINKICNNLLVFEMNEEDKNNLDILVRGIKEKIKYSDNNYIILKDQNIKLTDKEIRVIVANYINKNEKMSSFVVNYEYRYISNRKARNILNEIYNVGMNYLNIFSKSKLTTQSIIILKKSEIDKLLNAKTRFLTFAPCNEIKVPIKEVNKKEFLKRVERIYDSDVKAILKSFLLIIVGISVTANLLYALYTLKLVELITASIMYWCYTYVLEYMYNPIGKYKVLARYLLPVFIIIYFTIQLINGIKRKGVSNKRVHAS